jgi:hypothetical protein
MSEQSLLEKKDGKMAEEKDGKMVEGKVPSVLINWSSFKKYSKDQLDKQKQKRMIAMKKSDKHEGGFSYSYYHTIGEAFADPTCAAVVYTWNYDSAPNEEDDDDDDDEVEHCVGCDCNNKIYANKEDQKSAYLKINLKSCHMNGKQLAKLHTFLKDKERDVPEKVLTSDEDMFLEINSPYLEDEDNDVKPDGNTDTPIINFIDAFYYYEMFM